MGASREFWCFISYRHADNRDPGRQWATWLHQQMETYEIPEDLVGERNEAGDPIPERIFPVFRDEEELPVDADLSSPIYRALENSRYLVVLCSPQAVESTYVADEIRYFKKIGKADRVLAVMIEGEPNASIDPARQRAGMRECFPPPLQHPVDAEGELMLDQLAEPIAADFRLPGGAMGWTSPEAYRQALKAEPGGRGPAEIEKEVHRYAEQCKLALLKIIAGTLGVPLGTLTQRDKAYQLAKEQRRARIFRRVASAMAVLLVAAVIAGVVALQQRGRALEQQELAERNEQLAVEQRDEAERQRRLVQEQLAQVYLDRARDRLADNDEGASLPWLVRALETDPGLRDNPAVWAQIHGLIGEVTAPDTVLTAGGPAAFHAVSPDDRLVLLAGEDWNFLVYDLEREATQLPRQAFPEKPEAAYFFSDGRRLVLHGEHWLQVWNLHAPGLPPVETRLEAIHPWPAPRRIEAASVLGVHEAGRTGAIYLAVGGYTTSSFPEQNVPSHVLRWMPGGGKAEVIWELSADTGLNLESHPDLLCVDADGYPIVRFYTSEGSVLFQLDGAGGARRIDTQWEWVEGLPPTEAGVFLHGFGWNADRQDPALGRYFPRGGGPPRVLPADSVAGELPQPLEIVAGGQRNGRMLFWLRSRADDLADDAAGALLVQVEGMSGGAIRSEFLREIPAGVDSLFGVHAGGSAAAVFRRDTRRLELLEIGKAGAALSESPPAPSGFYPSAVEFGAPAEPHLLVRDFEKAYLWENGRWTGPYQSVPGIDATAIAAGGEAGSGRLAMISDGILGTFAVGAAPTPEREVILDTEGVMLDLRLAPNGDPSVLSRARKSRGGEGADPALFFRAHPELPVVPVPIPIGTTFSDDDRFHFVGMDRLVMESSYDRPFLTRLTDGERAPRTPLLLDAVDVQAGLAVRIVEERMPAWDGSDPGVLRLQGLPLEPAPASIWEVEVPPAELIGMQDGHLFLVDAPASNETDPLRLQVLDCRTGRAGERVSLEAPAEFGFGLGYFPVAGDLLVLRTDSDGEYLFVDPRSGRSVLEPLAAGGAFDRFQVRHSGEAVLAIADEQRSRYLVRHLRRRQGKWVARDFAVEGPWRHIAFHPDPELPLAVVENAVPTQISGGGVRLWDLRAGRPMTGFFLTDPKETGYSSLSSIEQVAWRPEHNLLFIRTQNRVFLFQDITGQLIRRLQSHPDRIEGAPDGFISENSITSMQVTAAGDWVLTGDRSGDVRRMRVEMTPVNLDRLRRLSAIFSGQRIDETGQLVPVDWARWGDTRR